MNGSLAKKMRKELKQARKQIKDECAKYVAEQFKVFVNTLDWVERIKLGLRVIFGKL